MTIQERIGVDIGVKTSIEDGISWAAENGIRFVDFRLETGPDAFTRLTPDRCQAIRQQAEQAGVTIGLHTLSAVNIAEFSPHLAQAADHYLRSYIDVAKLINAAWVEVHAGYHFTSDVEQRMAAGLERLKRAVAYAETQGVTLLLENMNWEPDHAEVHYLGHNLEECHYYFDAIDSSHLRWAFTVNHADLVPEGIDGFIDEMSLARCEEVRLADSHGQYEEHLVPGEGRIDFQQMFRRIESDRQFNGHYMCAFGSLTVMLEGRHYLIRQAEAAMA
ncbi:MAG: sugar phosphate isomerase/epimerase [bacterium]|nr:sugar phosphate isomerase/epimerase [bacterium]